MSQSDRLSKVAVEYQTALNLIDVVFSLECCLHYQVLPLELSDNHLVIGMVDPKNRDTIQQINPIVNSLGHSFHIQAIDTQIHQLVLAAYLKSGPKNFLPSDSSSPSKIMTPPIATSKKQFHPKNASPVINHESTLIDIPEPKHYPQPTNHESTLIDIPKPENYPQPTNHESTLIDIPKPENYPQSTNHKSTLIDIPKPENYPQSTNHKSTLIDIPKPEHYSQPTNHKSTLIDITEESVRNAVTTNANLHERPTFIISDQPEESATDRGNSHIFFGEAQINSINQNIVADSHKKVRQFPDINAQANSFSKSLQKLKGLPPKTIWQELLSGIFENGISKINLQQDNNYGRIICDQNGLVHASLNEISFSVFEGVIKEIKTMAKLPLSKLRKNRKIAIPKFYQNERLLLRIEFFVGKLGEEVVIQILRGQALKFYEQKQAEKTLEQALHLAQKLEKTLKKIKICQSSADINELRALKTIMQKVDRQLRAIDS